MIILIYGILATSPGTLPGHALGKKQAEFAFGPHDFRFTMGKDGSLYAYSMAVPAAGAEIKIRSLGSAENLPGKSVKPVSLLGHQGTPLQWKQQADTQVITAPSAMPYTMAVAFKID